MERCTCFSAKTDTHSSGTCASPLRRKQALGNINAVLTCAVLSAMRERILHETSLKSHSHCSDAFLAYF
jgi:hypothetical protein